VGKGKPLYVQHVDVDVVERVLAYARRIAVVGASPEPWRPSHSIAQFLIDAGFEVIPVNPTVDEVLDAPTYPNVQAIPGGVDLVDVFRRTEFLEEVARDAAAAGAKALWLQSGLRSVSARMIAEAAGMDFVEDQCLKVEILRRAD
jgi:predicted CoA-binding protein